MPRASANLNLNINLDVNTLIDQLDARCKDHHDDLAAFTKDVASLTFHACDSKCNVMVLNLALEHTAHTEGLAFYRSIVHAATGRRYGVWAFDYGMFSKGGQMGYPNWCMQGSFLRYGREGRDVVFIRTRKEQLQSNTNPTTLQQGDVMSSLSNDYKLIMQPDGNLVMYRRTSNHFEACWASNTWRQGHGPYRAVMQSDGNFVVYDGSDRPLWASNTWQPDCKRNEPYRVSVRNAGHFQIKNGNNSLMWQS